MPLKYLFTAYYLDQSSYRQTSEDISITAPGKSCYYDIDHEKLTKFELSDGINFHSVDLTNGSFTVNGFNFEINKPDFPLGRLRLIYYRKNTVILGQGGVDVVYNIGWQTTVNGENIKRIIEFR